MGIEDEDFGSALSDSRFREWETEFDDESAGLREENAELAHQLQVMTARYEALHDLLTEVADDMEGEDGRPNIATLLRTWLDAVEREGS